jgi:hypothetical protein
MQCRPSLKEISQFKHRSTELMKLEVVSLEIEKTVSRFKDFKRFDLFLSDQSSAPRSAWE